MIMSWGCAVFVPLQPVGDNHKQRMLHLFATGWFQENLFCVQVSDRKLRLGPSFHCFIVLCVSNYYAKWFWDSLLWLWWGSRAFEVQGSHPHPDKHDRSRAASLLQRVSL